MASLHSASHSPSRKFGSSGDVESSDDDEDDEQTRKYSKPSPKVYPSIIRHIIIRNKINTDHLFNNITEFQFRTKRVCCLNSSTLPSAWRLD